MGHPVRIELTRVGLLVYHAKECKFLDVKDRRQY